MMIRTARWAMALMPVLLTGGLRAADPPAVSISATKEYIEFMAGKELVARYQIAPSVAKPYLWPLNGPGGAIVTRAWPIEKGQEGGTTDHVHHKSVWFCHGDVIPEGMEIKDKIKGVEGVDFWSEAKGHGVIACVDVGKPKTDKNHGQVTTKNEWRTVDGTKIMDEMRTIHLYDFGDARLFVFDIDLHASVVPIKFGDTKEGSFGVRVNDEMREVTRKGKLENAEGKTSERNIWGQTSKWCDYSGPVGGRTVGLAIFDDPGNPGPSCWHSRAYGLHALNPFGRDKSGFPGVKGNTDLVKLAKGEHLKLRYGLLIHPGDGKEGNVAEYYQKFVELKEK